MREQKALLAHHRLVSVHEDDEIGAPPKIPIIKPIQIKVSIPMVALIPIKMVETKYE